MSIDQGDQIITGRDSTDPAQVGMFDAPYQKHSPTSKAAARRVDSETIRQQVYIEIKGRGDEGATDDEVQRALGLDGSTQRPRRVKLVEMGLVKASGRTRQTRSGREAAVWVAT